MKKMVCIFMLGSAAFAENTAIDILSTTFREVKQLRRSPETKDYKPFDPLFTKSHGLLNGTQSKISRTKYANEEERIKIIGGLAQEWVVQKQYNVDPIPFTNHLYKELDHEIKHLKSLQIMVFGARLVVDSGFSNRRNFFANLTKKCKQHTQDLNVFLRETILNVLFPEDFEKKISHYKNVKVEQDAPKFGPKTPPKPKLNTQQLVLSPKSKTQISEQCSAIVKDTLANHQGLRDLNSILKSTDLSIFMNLMKDVKSFDATSFKQIQGVLPQLNRFAQLIDGMDRSLTDFEDRFIEMQRNQALIQASHEHSQRTVMHQLIQLKNTLEEATGGPIDVELRTDQEGNNTLIMSPSKRGTSRAGFNTRRKKPLNIKVPFRLKDKKDDLEIYSIEDKELESVYIADDEESHETLTPPTSPYKDPSQNSLLTRYSEDEHTKESQSHLSYSSKILQNLLSEDDEKVNKDTLVNTCVIGTLDEDKQSDDSFLLSGPKQKTPSPHKKSMPVPLINEEHDREGHGDAKYTSYDSASELVEDPDSSIVKLSPDLKEKPQIPARLDSSMLKAKPKNPNRALPSKKKKLLSMQNASSSSSKDNSNALNTEADPVRVIPRPANVSIQTALNTDLLENGRPVVEPLVCSRPQQYDQEEELNTVPESLQIDEITDATEKPHQLQIIKSNNIFFQWMFPLKGLKVIFNGFSPIYRGIIHGFLGILINQHVSTPSNQDKESSE